MIWASFAALEENLRVAVTSSWVMQQDSNPEHQSKSTEQLQRHKILAQSRALTQ